MGIDVKRVKHRLKSDFQLSVVTGVCILSIISIAPMAVFRFLQGNVKVGILDTVLVLITLALGIFAWMSEKSGEVAFVLAASISLGVIFVVYMLGEPGLYWVYCTVMFNFALIKPQQALVLVFLVLTVVVAKVGPFDSQGNKLTFAMSVLTTTAFAFVFAHRSEAQRQLLVETTLTDPLTQAGNRRAYQAELNIAISEFKRSNQAYGIVTFDIDHFKRVNDTYGHDAGDNLLKSFSHLLKTNIRNNDRLFRVGGEEFVLLISNTSARAVRLVAEKLRNLVADEMIVGDSSVTVSAGISLVREGDTPESWVKRSDQALYHAKNSGRNRCVIYDDITETLRVVSSASDPAKIG